jgi:6,7-dimethyl-8-ribityllumazine synthase
MRIAVIVSSFNGEITEKLLGGALECLRKHGAADSDFAVFRCPGAFELPQAASMLARSDRWDAIICLGAVIRGETPHFNYVAAQAAAGIQQVALTHGLPVAFGVLTTETPRQAADRAGGKHGNKGWDAALTAMEMIALKRSLRKRTRTPARKKR